MADFRTRHLENKAELSATRGRGWLRRCRKDPRHPGCAIKRPQKICLDHEKNVFFEILFSFFWFFTLGYPLEPGLEAPMSFF